MNDSGVIHTARSGSVTVKVRGLDKVPAVADLCGYDPDPRRLPADSVLVDGEWVTFLLNWTKGDARLFYIDFTVDNTPVLFTGDRRPACGFSIRYRAGLLRIAGPDKKPFVVTLFRLDGRVAYRKTAAGVLVVPAVTLGTGQYVVSVMAGREGTVRKIAVY